MTEEEKALGGYLFNPTHPELVEKKRPAHNLCVDYGMLHEEDPKRAIILEKLLKKMGKNIRMQGPIFFNYGCHTTIGDSFFANYNFTVQDDASVTIGDYFMAGPNVSLITAQHPLMASERAGIVGTDGQVWSPCYAEPIQIGNHVWLGAGVIVCPGVTIGDNVVVGAGSVVLHDIPSNTVAVGVPARVLREITSADSALGRLYQE